MTSELTYQKLRGGYYTPPEITDFVANWAIRSANDSILEPSCGDGAFVESSVEKLVSLGATEKDIKDILKAIELDPNEAKKTRGRVQQLNVTLDDNNIESSDFFSYLKGNKEKYDIVVGNPPFIRYQNFVEEYRTIAFDLMNEAGLKPNRLTNIWVPFLVLSSLMLNENGRIGMIIPAELFQVDYASETRNFLSEYFDRLTIITFRELVFDDAQQEVVLLLGEKHVSDKQGIRTVELNSKEDLKRLKMDEILDQPIKPLEHSSEKWTKYFLDIEEIFLLRKLKIHPAVTLSKDVIDVDVGIVTGQNKYFVVNEDDAKKHNIKSYTERLVGRSNHLKGVNFSNDDWDVIKSNGQPCMLFYPENEDVNELPKDVKEYIFFGEENNVHTGYKCSIRKRWYIVPSVRVSDAFMLRQVHEYPKLINNEAGAVCTDTIHRVRIQEDYDARMVSSAFMNSLTFAFSEITGRSYGGGVLTFEPSEAERLPIPLNGADELNFYEIDSLLRNNDINSVLEVTDEVLLKNGLGLSDNEISTLRGIWNKLRDRRINRKKSRKKGKKK